MNYKKIGWWLLIKDIINTTRAWLISEQDDFQKNKDKAKQRIGDNDPRRYDLCLFCGCFKWEHFMYIKNMEDGLSCSVTRGKLHRGKCPKNCQMFIDTEHHQGE